MGSPYPFQAGVQANGLVWNGQQWVYANNNTQQQYRPPVGGEGIGGMFHYNQQGYSSPQWQPPPSVPSLVWDAENKKWVSPQQGQTYQPYSSPNPVPQSIQEYEQNLLTNPALITNSQNNPLGKEAGLISSILAQREANKKTDEDFSNALGALKTGSAARSGMYDASQKSALNDVYRMTGKAQANSNAGMMGRGLYNTTLANAMTNRATEAGARAAGSVYGQFGELRGNAAYQSGKDIADLYGQRTRARNNSMYGNMLNAAMMNQTGNSSGGSAAQAFGAGVSAIGTIAALAMLA